jgi:FKBP-type peptidyl-prolyl cis-trans isomerase FkpA
MRVSANSDTKVELMQLNVGLKWLVMTTVAAVALGCGEQGGGQGGGTVTELIKTDTRTGTGPEAASGQNVTVHYTGWLYDAAREDHKGQKFDSSRDRNEPFSFRLGAGDVIAGWDQGVAGMRVGGQRTLTIPSALGYGSAGAGGVIPPDAVLVFDVELLGVN